MCYGVPAIRSQLSDDKAAGQSIHRSTLVWYSEETLRFDSPAVSSTDNHT